MMSAATIVTAGLRVLSSCICATTDCDQLILEANIPIPGSGGVVAVDGDLVWVSNGNAGLRYTKVAGTWQNDAFVSNPSTTDASLFDAGGGRVVFGNKVFGPAVPYQLTAEVFPSGPTCGQPGIGNIFVAGIMWGCGNVGISSLSPNGGLFYPITSWTNPYGLQSGRAAAHGAYAYAWVAGGNGVPGPIEVKRWLVNGTPSQISSISADGYPLGPVGIYASHLAPLGNGVALTYIDTTAGNSLRSVAVHLDGAWTKVPTVWGSNDNPIVAISDRIFAVGDRLLWEVVRDPTGTWTVVQRQGGLWGLVDLDGDGSLLAATVLDPATPSGLRLIIMRLATSIDCDSDGTPDCEELAGGAPDVNGNGTPDECECLADLFADGTVNGADLGIALSQWGQGKGSVADINRDGIVDGSDLSILLNSWGACP